MCGICGVFSASIKANSEDTLSQIAAMSELMRRRGPDDAGVWTDGVQCALGFRRLAILDLTASGHQPMISRNGRFALVFNGEVYNFVELRTELEKRGVRFRSSGDTEVVLAALVEWGTDALKRFNGMFALAFYDCYERTMVLARDHAGIKPLYYLLDGERLVFGSQFNQLTRHKWGRELNVSPAAASLYVRFGYTPAPFALLEKTHLLDAGCWLKMDAHGQVKHGRFYDFPRFAHPDLKGEAAIDAVDAALRRAVKRHLVSDVPIGVFLSGGIDSPLVAAEAAREHPHRLKAFSIGVADSEADDESEAARRYADEIGVEHITRFANQNVAFEMVDEVIEACSEPTADFSIFPTLMVSRLAREQVTVALSGDGGDELFWGYPQRFGSALTQAGYFRLPRAMRYVNIASRKFLSRGAATRDVLRRDVGQLYQQKHTIFAEADLTELFKTLAPVPAALDLFDFHRTDPEELAQWLRWNEFRLHLARILLKVDRASMHHSLEVRVPLLDKEVIEVAARTCWRSCLDLQTKIGKLPLRGALKRRVKFQTQAKKGFTVPMHEWLTTTLQPLLQDKVLTRREFLGMEVNTPHLHRMNRELLRGNQSPARGLWLLLSLALWEEKHLHHRYQPVPAMPAPMLWSSPDIACQRAGGD